MNAPSAAPADRPPYGYALLAALTVLAGYVYTLAPTVTFWDAGEFIAASHILGIPHPPGTPLFIMLGRVWDMMAPGVPTAFKTNLMSATFSAGSAGFLFLFMHQALARGAAGLDAPAAKLFRIGGAFAAALIGAFVFTNWQNSNETEVYQVAMFSIGVIAWLLWLWRRDRGGVRGAHELLLLMYMLSVSLGNHLMALLCGPAVIAYMFHVLRTAPARDPAEQQVQWAQWAIVGSLWVSMVGVGVASRGIIVIGLLLFAAAAVWAFKVKSGLFAVVGLIVAAIGVSTYLFLYIRAGQHPFISEADPSTLRNLWAVMGREQYPPRSPFDNPIYPSGPDNPGRTLQIFGLQLLNYIQYFDWQFSSSLQRGLTVLAPARLPFTILFTFLGVLGATEHRKWDRSSFWFIATLFATTSIGLILYLNFKPGFSVGLTAFPDREAHEVRERDYFYTVSFVAFGLWAGLGIAVAYKRLRERIGGGWATAAPVMLLGLLPFTLNFTAASRHHGPSARLPRDFAYNMLMSVEPYGLLFTNGDNDTFPLWYLQEAEGVRQDVMVVNLSLINTDWYIRQLRDLPARPYRPDSNAVRLYGDSAAAGPPPHCSPAWQDTLAAWSRRAGQRPFNRDQGWSMCLHTLNDDQIQLIQPRLLERDIVLRAGTIQHTYPAGTPMYVKDIMTLRLIMENHGRRPMFFALTAGQGNRMGLDRYMSQRGIVFKLNADTVRAGPDMAPGLFNTLVDVPMTETLANTVYRYARLFDVDTLELDPTDDNIAGNLSFTFMTLGEVYRQRNDVAGMLTNYQKAGQLSPNPELQRYLAQLRAISTTPDLFDTDSAAAGADSGAGQRP